MTEYSAFPADELIAQNGHEGAAALPRVDPVRGVFLASNGNVIPLSGKEINYLILQQIQNQGKPAIPKREVTIGGKYKQVEENPQDPAYLKALEDWHSETGIRAGRYLFTVGVKGQPDAAFWEEYADFFPDATTSEKKYLWVCSLVPNDDLPRLIEAIMGQTMPTEKGLEQSAESFRSEG